MSGPSSPTSASTGDGPSTVRLAELCGVLSLTADLAVGQRLESGIRSTLVAVAIAETLGLDDRERADVYYLNLLRMAGCTATPEMADVMGDLRKLGERFDETATDFGDKKAAMPLIMKHLTEGQPPLTKVRNVARAARMRPRDQQAIHSAHCEVAKQIGRRLEATDAVLDALDFTYERWDGSGTPSGRKGDDIPLATRIVNVAYHAEMLQRAGSPDEARTALRVRAGRALDPGVTEAACRDLVSVLGVLDCPSAWSALLDAEPGAARMVPDDDSPDHGVDAALTALGDFGEALAWMKGHGRRVAALVEAAAPSVKLGPLDALAARRAGHVHDIGTLAGSMPALDRAGPLGELERDEAQLHAHHGERVLSRSSALAGVAKVVGLHHERADGSGYHRQLSGPSIPMNARLVAAADVYDALTSDRPHRAAFTRDAAAQELDAMATAGRLDAAAVGAVLEAAGHRVAKRPQVWPLGLTDREVDVLRTVARGFSIKQAAKELDVSPKTVDAHLQKIYPKLGVSTRAGATMSAVELGLLSTDTD